MQAEKLKMLEVGATMQASAEHIAPSHQTSKPSHQTPPNETRKPSHDQSREDQSSAVQCHNFHNSSSYHPWTSP